MQRKRNERSTDLLEHFQPVQEADLAIHAKKIEELKQWLTAAKRQQHPANQILLITGPSGSGKSVCLKTLAKALGYSIHEWTTPVDVDLFYDDKFDFDDREERKGRRPQKALFDEFLYKTSRYCSLFSDAAGESSKLLLVKDFPNSMLRSAEEFHDSLERYLDNSTDPIVFIATDTSSKSVDVAYNLFPPSVMESFQIHQIKFNAVSVTLLRKAIKRICGIIKADKEFSKQYQTVSSKLMEEDIVVSSQGDLRNCCLNYLFTCMKSEYGGRGLKRLRLDSSKSGSKAAKSSTGTSKKQHHPLGLNENLTIMHGLGRIFHPKFCQQDGETRFVHSPESIAECFLTQPSSLISLLHSNYVTRFTDILNVASAADSLTVVDGIMNEYRSDQLATYGLTVAVRSMMVNNEHPAHGFQPIRKKIKVQLHESTTSYSEELKKAGLILRPIPAQLLATEYKGYVSIIRKPMINKVQN